MNFFFTTYYQKNVYYANTYQNTNNLVSIFSSYKLTCNLTASNEHYPLHFEIYTCSSLANTFYLNLRFWPSKS